MLRVATLNLLHNPDVLEERVTRLADELADEKLDFLLLQEVFHPGRGTGVDALRVLGDKLGMKHAARTVADGFSDGTAILSRHPLTTLPTRLSPATVTPPPPPPTIARTCIDGRSVVVISHHGAWGPHSAVERMEQLRFLNTVAREEFTRDGAHLDQRTRPVIVLGGDFNAEPSALPIRWLRGDDPYEGESTIWVKASSDEPTTGGSNPFAISTAQSMPSGSYRPHRTPRRCIDHIFVYEWCYGRAGEPERTRRFAHTTFTDSLGRLRSISDHDGVLVDLWMPAPDAS